MNESSTLRRIRAALLAIATLTVAPSCPAADPSPKELLEKVQAWIDGTRDLEARFEQTLESGALGSGTKESGKIFVKRPGRIRWEYTDPEPKVALLLGDRTLLYLPEDRQLLRGKLEEDQGLLAQVLAGRGRLAELFEAGPAPRSEGADRLRLVPRGKGEGVAEVVLTVRPPGFAIEEAEVLDGMGNRTSYRFRSVRRNRGLRDTLFQLEPPPGTSIVEQ